MKQLVLVLWAAAIAATTAVPATAADECRGLPVCLPVAGPWVVVPARAERAALSRVEYELRCPLPNYVVAGVDARLADPEIDVSFRAETGSPIGPGVTTQRAVLFAASPTAPTARPTSFRPFIGCVPLSGGGSRSQTAYTATPPGGLPPTRPSERTIVTRRIGAPAAVVIARCPAGARLLGGAHAIAFHTDAPPTRPLVTAVHVTRSVAGGAVVARVTVRPGVLGVVRAEIQLHAVCRKAAP